MMGGINIPPIEAAGSTAPATWPLNPALFINGMVKAPGATSTVTDRCQRKVNKESLCSRCLEKGTKEHKQEDIGCEDIGHDAEDAILAKEYVCTDSQK